MGRAKAKQSSRARVGGTHGKRIPGPEAEPLKGVGPFSLRVLHSLGIFTRADLDRVGPVRTFMAAKRIEPRVTLNFLWGVAGIVTGTHWSRLPAGYRSSLLLEYDAQLDAERSLAAPSNKSLKRTRD